MKQKAYYQNGEKESKKRVTSNMPPKKKNDIFNRSFKKFKLLARSIT